MEARSVREIHNPFPPLSRQQHNWGPPHHSSEMIFKKPTRWHRIGIFGGTGPFELARRQPADEGRLRIEATALTGVRRLIRRVLVNFARPISTDRREVVRRLRGEGPEGIFGSLLGAFLLS